MQVEVRGRGRSGGDKSDNIGLQVGRDGHDAVEWIAAQPWSDGHVFMYGGWFVGMTQWHTASQLPPHLAGIAPYVPIYPGWDVPRIGYEDPKNARVAHITLVHGGSRASALSLPLAAQSSMP